MRIIKMIAVAGLLGMTTPGWAHHTFAMFDFCKETELSGTVVAFTWTNPHAWLEVKKNGTDEVWRLEGTSIGQMMRAGWKSITVKPGDKVTVSIRPLKVGGQGGQLVDVTLADGTFLTAGGVPGRKGGPGAFTGLRTIPGGAGQPQAPGGQNCANQNPDNPAPATPPAQPAKPTEKPTPRGR